MTTGNLLLAALGMFVLPGQSTLPTQTGPMRNTFVVADETVIDTASAIDITEADASFRVQMQQVKAAKANLSGMAEDQRERDAASATDDLIFAVAACHIQAKDGANTDKCRAQIAQARTRAMEALNKHKGNGTWLDGPPTR